MATPYNLKIVTPEKLFFEGEVSTVVMSTIGGEMGILAKHVPGVAGILPSVIRMESGGKWRNASVSGGFALIAPDGVSVLADAVEWPEDIEISRAQEAKRRAEERLASKADSIDIARAQGALQRACARIKAYELK